MAIEVDYRFPVGAPAAKLATVIAVGQTAGSWSERWADRDGALRAHLGTVEAIVEQADGATVATIAFPEANVAPGDLGGLLTMIFGKYSMAGVGRVVEVRLPDAWGTRPTVGLSGLRQRTGVFDRPLVMAIFKPALGLSAADHATLLREVAEAGVDCIKDDEILGDAAAAPTLDRVTACREVLDAVQAATGRAPVYLTNLTPPGQGSAGVSAPRTLADRARELVDAGANGLLFNGLTYGWQALAEVRAAVDVPIFLHPAFAGALSGAPDFGLDYAVVLGTLAARSGVDAVLYPAHYGSLPFDPDEEARIRDALRGRDVAPVPSAGIVPGVVPRALADYGRDVLLNAGTGIMDHPDGPGAGVRAFHEALAWHATGQPFTAEAVPAGPLKTALETWGVT